MTGRAVVILSVALAAAALVCAGGVSASEGLHIAGTEPAEHALSVDTPMRLAQRSRMAERAAAVEAAGKTAESEEDGSESEEGAADETETDRALDAALVETGAVAHDRSRGRNRGRGGYVPGPAWSRLTGASKTYHPNDQMCVLCQFLVERTQLDLAHFNTMGNFLGARNAAGGSATAASTGGVGKGAGETAFLQIAEGDDAEEAGAEEEESEAEDESESAEADWEAEDAKEAAALEISAREQLAEHDGDWEAAAQLDDAVKAIHSDAHRNDEDAEEADSEEETTEQQANAPTSSLALAEVSADVEALTDAEKAEFNEVMREFHDESVVGAVQEQLEAATTPQTVERNVEQGDADAEAEEEEDTAFIQVSDDSEEEGEDEGEDEGEADAEDDLELDNESEGEAEGEDEMNEEEVTPDMVSNGERADLMDALGDSFDSEINLDADEKSELIALRTPEAAHGFERPDWGMPTYNADGQSEEDTTSITTEARDVDAGESLLEANADAADTEERSDEAYRVEFVGDERAPNGQGRREYAKLLHRAEDAPVLAEMQSHAFMSDGGRARTRGRGRNGVIPRYAPAPLGVGVANSPRRFRLSDALLSRPNWNRFDPTIKPHPNAQRTAAREMWNKLLHMTYDRLEGYCSTRLPEQFTPFCRPMLKRFRVIAEGLRYGDRPNQICMRTRFCPRGSYVRRSPHNVFKHVQV